MHFSALSRIRSRLPVLAPAEKIALIALLAVLGTGGLLRAWERSGVALGPVDDWESLRALIVRSRDDFARQGGSREGGGYPCAVDDRSEGFGDAGSAGEDLLAAGTGSFKPRGKGAGGGKKTPPAKPIDLNAASERALLALPGVGPSTAKAIVAHRGPHGKFRSVDDLLQVKGIGPKKLEALRPYVRVTVPSDRVDSADSVPH